MSLKRDNEFQSMQRSLTIFENAIHSDATMKLYTKGLEKFMQFVGHSNRYDDFALLDSKVIDRHLEDYVMFQSRRQTKGISIRGYLKPVYLFLDVNRIQYFPKAINRLIPKDKTKKGNCKQFTDEDIQNMLDYTNNLNSQILGFVFARAFLDCCPFS